MNEEEIEYEGLEADTAELEGSFADENEDSEQEDISREISGMNEEQS